MLLPRLDRGGVACLGWPQTGEVLFVIVAFGVPCPYTRLRNGTSHGEEATQTTHVTTSSDAWVTGSTVFVVVDMLFVLLSTFAM